MSRSLIRNYERLQQCEEASDLERQRKLAFAKTTIGITMREGGVCRVEENVYGAAIVMPQVARTTGWDKTVLILAVRSVFFLAFNICLQCYALTMLSKEDNVMNKFSGEMYLCDFGAFAENCPGPGCLGPGGTDVTAPRMYDIESYLKRKFVRDSFIALFPDRVTEAFEKVDIGEYGVEDYLLRWTCCFVFMISCMDDLVLTYKMAELLYQIPTKDEPWIEPLADITVRGSVDEVRFKIAGMPMMWKLINGLIVVCPKLFLWKLTCEVGVSFLMNTSTIGDIVINSVAITFIINLDELIYNALMSEETRRVVAATESFALFNAHTSCVGDMSLLTDDEILEKHHEQQGLRSWSIADLVAILPQKFFFALLLTTGFISLYYLEHCNPNTEKPELTVSKDMYLPKSVSYYFLNACCQFLFPVPSEETPYWRMPNITRT